MKYIETLCLAAILFWAAGSGRAATTPIFDGATLGGPVFDDTPHANGAQTHDYQSHTPLPVACPTSSQHSTSVLCIRGAALPGSSQQNYLVNINLDSYAGATPDSVALFSAVLSHSGSPGVWALNTITALDPGSTGGIGYELDLNNFACDAGTGQGIAANPSCTLKAPPIGLLVTGSSAFPNGTGIVLSGNSYPANPQWHDGLSVIGPGIVGNATFHTNDDAAYDYLLQGSHAYGIEMSSASFAGAAMHLSEKQALLWTTAAGDASITANAGGLVVSGRKNNFVGPGPLILGEPNLKTSQVAIVTDRRGDLAITGTASTPNVELPEGSKICWRSPETENPCVYHASGKLYYRVSGHTLFSIDDRTGDAVFRGRVTSSGRP